MDTSNPIAVVGAGFSGAVIAHCLASRGRKVVVFESRNHVAGNCHTERDSETGVMVHVYGPHIFHTNNEHVWDFINQFGKFSPYINRVKAISNGKIYSLPINLLTINQFFGTVFSPAEAANFIASLGDINITEPNSFEEQALKFLGKDLYQAFFRGYTVKQWGVDPKTLPASILKRLPVRFNYNDNYYDSMYQGIPVDGYTNIVKIMLNNENICLRLGETFSRGEYIHQFSHIFYTGPIDTWFRHDFGRLRYRTLDFVTERHKGDFQGNAVINYCDEEFPWTRITEHKYFAPWETHANTIIFREYSRDCGAVDIPYYPVRLLSDKELLKKYVDRARHEVGITFVGRLGTYRYLDMHVAIAEALNAAKMFLEFSQQGNTMPTFVNDPLA